MLAVAVPGDQYVKKKRSNNELFFILNTLGLICPCLKMNHTDTSSFSILK